MALVSCPECNRHVSEKAPQCPHCGCPISTATGPQKSKSSGGGSPSEGHRSFRLTTALTLGEFGWAIGKLLCVGVVIFGFVAIRSCVEEANKQNLNEEIKKHEDAIREKAAQDAARGVGRVVPEIKNSNKDKK